MKYFWLLLSLLLVTVKICGQEPVSIHQLQSKQYKNKTIEDEAKWDSVNNYKFFQRSLAATQCKLKKIVFGWHPYWSGSSYNEYDFSLLSDIAYFSYEVNPSNGSYTDIHSWKTTPLVELAKQRGTRISLTVTLFSSHKTFFENALSQQTLIDSLLSLIKLRGAHGVNIDFEAVPSGQREHLTSFMQKLSTRFHTDIPGSLISIALPAVDWNKVFDVKAMHPYVDLFIIMGYDYHYPGSTKAGPVSPKNNGTLWSPQDVTRSVRNYLQSGIPKEKLCLGVPYYGYDWPTADTINNSATTGKGTARLYKDAIISSETNGRKWDRHSSVPYSVYRISDSWRQCWYDDSLSLGYKYDMVNMYDIGGIGIWALGYDRTRRELWNLLREKFTNCGSSCSSRSITDMGGPEGNYFSNDNFAFYITGNDGGPTSVSFIDFDLAPFDTLFAYSGETLGKNLIGKYTGQQNPWVINSDSAISFRFTSGSATPEKGWQAYPNCSKAVNPETIHLTSRSIAENSPEKTLIGKFIVHDSIASGCTSSGSQCFSYSIHGDSDNNSFLEISNDSIFSNTIFDYEKKKKYNIDVKGENDKGLTIFRRLEINITDVNEPPKILQTVPDQTITLGEPFAVQLPKDIFTDPDSGDFVNISLSEVFSNNPPAWLIFNQENMQLSGLPRGEDGIRKMLLTATDKTGLKTSISFNMSVIKPIGYVDTMISEIEVFPSPTRDVTFITISQSHRFHSYAYLFDSRGSKIGRIRLTFDALDRQVAMINLSYLPNGIYFIRFTSKDKTIVKRILVIK